MELIIVRHGESEYNTDVSESLDSSLTTKGILQVKKTAEYLKKIDLSGFEGITSPYLRTLQTAKIIQGETDIPFRVDNGPAELTIYYNSSESRERIDFLDVPKRDFEFDWPSVWDGRFAAEENLEDFLCRVESFLSGLDKDGKYLIVSHGSPVHTMSNLMQGIREVPEWSDSIANSSITWLENDNLKYLSKVVYD
jgi:broad specificity phosphatase PhoE